MDSPIEQKSFVRKVLIVVGIVTFVWGALQILLLLLDVIMLAFAGILIAIFLRGLADLTRRYTKLSEGLSVLLVSVLLLGILSGAVALLAPSVGEQIQHLREELPNSAKQASNYIAQFSWGRTLIDQMPSTDEIIQNIDASTVLSRVGGYFSSTLGAVGNFFVMILLAIYLAIEPQFYADGFAKLFPIRMRPRVREVLDTIAETLSWWLIGKAASMLFIGVLTWIGLWILGVPLSLTLGLIAGLLSFIPNFGPILSAVPAILLGFIDSPIKALYVLILFIVVQIIESNLVTPMIERRTVELPPALTIIAQIALGILLGAVGLILATPLVAVLMVVVQMVYIQDVLGDKNVEAEHKDLNKRAKEKAAEKAEELGEKEEIEK